MTEVFLYFWYKFRGGVSTIVTVLSCASRISMLGGFASSCIKGKTDARGLG